MRALIAHPFIRVGGAERIIFHLTRYLMDKGVEVAIATLGVDFAGLPPDVHGFTYLTPPRMREESVRSYKLRTTAGLASETLLLRKLVRTEGRRFSVLNPHNFPAMWACAMDDRPVVWMCNEPPYTWANPNPSLPIQVITRLGMPLDAMVVRRYANRIVSCSEWTEERVRARYGRDSVILYPGVDSGFYSSTPSGPPPFPDGIGDRFLLLQVGELIPKKNQLASIRAVDTLASEGMTDLALYIIGKDTTPYGQEVRNEIARRHLEDRVRLLGSCSDDQIRAAYHAADLLLFPSQAESFGMAVLEALCAGTPCVVSPEAGVSGLIERVGGGIVARDLSAGIRRIRSDPGRFARMIPRAQEYIRDHVNWDTYCRGMWKIMENADRDGAARTALRKA